MEEENKTVVQTNKNDSAWYIINTYSTHENRVKENLTRRIESMGLSNLIHRLFVAEVEVDVYSDGQATGKKKLKNLYPGYVFIEMEMTDDAWFVVRNTPGVTGFVGSSGKGTKPFPVPREEMEVILKKMGVVDDAMYERYHEGDYVKVINGPFTDQEGKILSIDKVENKVVVESFFFGRISKLEVDFTDIEKI